MSIQVAINGNRTEEIVPKTVESIVDSAVSAVRAGATSIHFHPRDNYGNETFIAEFVEAQISGLRKAFKNIPIGISTGEWIEPNIEKRLAQIDSWKILPDFVSINYDENDCAKVADLVSAKGIKIEVGLNSLEAAIKFTNIHSKGDILRILIEPQESNLDLAIDNSDKISKYIKDCGIDKPFLLHGVGETCWTLVELAFVKNYETRIGFEDILELVNGESAKSNAELVDQALKIKSKILSLKSHI